MSVNKGSFKKGNKPWNKNLKGIHLSPDSEFKSGDNHTGENHPSWKGGVQTFADDCAYVWSGTNERKRRPRVVYEENYGTIPKGYVIKRYLKETSLTKNLDIAPRPPPNPISKKFIMHQL